MKIILTEEVKKFIDELVLAQNQNILSNDIYNFYLQEDNSSLSQKLKQYHFESTEQCQKTFAKSFFDYLEINQNDKEFKSTIKNCQMNKFTLLDENKYLTNPYYKNISPSTIKTSSWNFGINYFEPYQAFLYKDISIDSLNEINSLGFFNKRVPYFYVAQNNVIWMSITPHEIETMDESINKSKGNIIVFGLGLGYYPYMCSLKKNVSHITIIEKNPTIIKMFKTSILPQFLNKDKITIINGDAYDYLNKMNNYDFAFVDLWHNFDDGLPFYIEFKKVEKNYPSLYIDYWIENSLLLFFRRALINLIIEQSDFKNKYNYTKEKDLNDHIINNFYRLTKDYTIHSKKDLLNLIDINSIKELITRFN